MACPLLNTILNDIKKAMRNKDKFTLTSLRTLHSEIKNIGINERREVTDDDVLTTITKMIKQQNDSLVQFRKGGREEQCKKLEAQTALYKSYLPPSLTDEELEVLVKEAIEKTGASGKRDMGKVMKVLMPHVKGKADGKKVSQAVMRQLP